MSDASRVKDFVRSRMLEDAFTLFAIASADVRGTFFRKNIHDDVADYLRTGDAPAYVLTYLDRKEAIIIVRSH